jgi:hypothetical protein
MRNVRLAVVGSVVLVSAILAYLLRDVMYQLVVVPLAYSLWLLEVVYLAIPQLLKWVLLVVLLFLGIIWKLIPDMPASPKPRSPRRSIEGRVESLAIGIHRSRTSNYFKWQVANRLGRLARRISDTRALPEALERGSPSIQGYLAAGLNQSFVDFPTPRARFARRLPTPLDIDPGAIVEYLESRMELSHDGRPRSR